MFGATELGLFVWVPTNETSLVAGIGYAFQGSRGAREDEGSR